MRPRHILVIDPAMHTPELDSFNRMAASAPVPCTYHLPALHGLGSVRRDESNACGIVVMGSASSVNDRHPWQLELGAWLLERMTAGIPTLGLCFGHQLIGELYGSRVDFLFPDQRKLAGFEQTDLVANPLWGAAGTRPLYASHREHVTSCPASMVITATRPSVPFDGFAHVALPIWTFQTHPEATPAFLENRGLVDEGDPSRYTHGHAIVDNFLKLAATA